MKKTSLFKRRISSDSLSLTDIFNALQSSITSPTSKVLNSAPKTYSLESAEFDVTSAEYSNLQVDSRDNVNSFNDMVKNIKCAIEGIHGLGAVGADKFFSYENYAAASLALSEANGAGNITSASLAGVRDLRDGPGVLVQSYKSKSYASQSVADIVGTERFDNNANFKGYRVTTTALQLVNSRQTGYLNLVYPSATLGFNENGFILETPIGRIQDQAFIRHADGSAQDIQKNSLVSMYRNASSEVTQNNRLHPIVNSAWQKEYLETTYGLSEEVAFTGETVNSAPVKVGVTFDYMKVCMPEGYTAGEYDDSDSSIAPGGSLESLFFDFGAGDIITLNVTNDTHGARFVMNNTTGQRGTSEYMDFRTGVQYTKDNISDVTGLKDSATLAKLIAGGEKIVLDVKFTANINLESSELSTSAASVVIRRVADANGITVPYEKWSDDQKAFNKAQYKPTAVKFDLRKSMTNMDVMGDIVHVDYIQSQFEAGWNKPVSFRLPVNVTDSPELLIVMKKAVDLYKHRLATAKIFEGAKRLHDSYAISLNEPSYTFGKFVGALSYLPYYHQNTINVSEALVNEKSSELTTDIAGILAATLKDEISLMLTNSGYIQELNSQYIVNETQAGMIIGIVTSQYIADWLAVAIERKLFGKEYEVRVEVNPSKAFDNRMFIFPTTLDNGRSEISSLQFGLSLDAPDIVYDATRSSGNSKTYRELRLVNRWTPYQLGCACVMLTISDISTVVNNRVKRTVVIEGADSDVITPTPPAGNGE